MVCWNYLKFFAEGAKRILNDCNKESLIQQCFIIHNCLRGHTVAGHSLWVMMVRNGGKGSRPIKPVQTQSRRKFKAHRRWHGPINHSVSPGRPEATTHCHVLHPLSFVWEGVCFNIAHSFITSYGLASFFRLHSMRFWFQPFLLLFSCFFLSVSCCFCQQSSGNCNRHLPFSISNSNPLHSLLCFPFIFGWCVPHYCFLWFILGFKWLPLPFNTLCLLFGLGHDDLARALGANICHLTLVPRRGLVSVSFTFTAFLLFSLLGCEFGFYFGFCFWFAVLNRWRRLRSLFATLHAAP